MRFRKFWYNAVGFRKRQAVSCVTELSIIIVSWNVAYLLRRCLETIIATAPTAEIIVVDSASTDNSAQMVREEFPQVMLLPQFENLGYTRCNNIGLRVASGRFLMLLNPDTEIVGDALARMTTYLAQHPEIGITGPHTLNTDGTTQSTRRRFPSVQLAFFESTWLQSYTPRQWMDDFIFAGKPDDATFEVDWVQGSALMARREVYEQIGGLDEGYIMYSEELDWCRRAKASGWRVAYIGSAQIIHHGGKSSDQIAARRHIYFQQSKLRYFRKFHGVLVALILRLFLLLTYSWQIGLELVKALLGSKRAMRTERVRAYIQVIRSGLKVT